MFIWHRRGNLRFALALLVSLSVLQPSFAHGASDPQALTCIETFLQAYKSVREYESIMTKREWDKKENLVHEERIKLHFLKPEKITFEYLNQGNTGIRNNGMTITYNSGDQVEVRFGTTHGLGFLIKAIASVVTPTKMSLFDSKVLDAEIFTLNRAGFDYLAKALTFHLPELKISEYGEVSLKEKNGCKIKYAPHLSGDTPVIVKINDSIFRIEEQYGTLAYALYLRNKESFRSFKDLFVRKSDLTILIPKSFLEFELELDPITKMPSNFILYSNNKKIGSYAFESTRLVDQ